MLPETKEQAKTIEGSQKALPKKLYILGAVLLLASIIIGLSIYFSKPSKPFTQAQINITSQGFTPQTLLIKAGTRVTWTNSDVVLHQISADPHPTHSSLPSLTSSALQRNQTYSFTFETPGTYTYHDEKNPLKLRGSIVVK